jgi:hypothetical protein
MEDTRDLLIDCLEAIQGLNKALAIIGIKVESTTALEDRIENAIKDAWRN